MIYADSRLTAFFAVLARITFLSSGTASTSRKQLYSTSNFVCQPFSVISKVNNRATYHRGTLTKIVDRSAIEEAMLISQPA